MSTIIEKINIIDTEKQNIKKSIEGKGATVTDSLASFAPAIESIQTGGKIEPKKTLDVITNGNYKINTSAGFGGIEGATINVNVPSSPVDPSDMMEFAKIGWDKIYGYAPVDSGETYEHYTARTKNGINYGVDKYNNWDSSSTSASSYFFRMNIIYAPKINMKNVTDAKNMFGRCAALQVLPELITDKVITMEGMFAGCARLVKIPEFNIISINSSINMFNGCGKLVEVKFKGGHKGIDCSNMFSGINTTGKAYFKNDGGDYSDIIAVLPATWTYEYYD